VLPRRAAARARRRHPEFACAPRLEAKARDETLRILAELGLERLAEERAKNLPYGDQRRLEIARALATGPRLLLLDEPTAGMNRARRRRWRRRSANCATATD